MCIAHDEHASDQIEPGDVALTTSMASTTRYWCKVHTMYRDMLEEYYALKHVIAHGVCMKLRVSGSLPDALVLGCSLPDLVG